MTLRICRGCGLEANTEEDLEKFTKMEFCRYGRDNFCKSCQSKRVIKDYSTNDVSYVKRILVGMKRRCNQKNWEFYSYYGGRGIAVCSEWDNPDVFIKWALENGFERGLQIDRIDNDGNYAPDNCRWVTSNENMRNRAYHSTNYENLTRICRKCKISKPLTNFHGDDTKSMGRTYICKKCDNERRKNL